MTGWASKTALKLNTIVLDDDEWARQEGLPTQIPIKTGGKDGGRMALSEVFSNISNVVCAKLNHLIEQQIARKNHDIAAGIIKDDEEYTAQDILNDEINQREMIQDFATEEFIQKNIRVRPASGVTTGGNAGDEAKSENFAAGRASADAPDEEERMHNFLIDAQRKEAKERKMIAEKKKQQELELLAKQKNKSK